MRFYLKGALADLFYLCLLLAVAVYFVHAATGIPVAMVPGAMAVMLKEIVGS